MSATYRIQDEPRPGAMGHLVVNPLFPLLAAMMAGPWLSVPWFIFNGFAMGSTTRLKETVLALAQLPVSLLLMYGLGSLLEAGVLTQTSGRYAAVGVTVWRLTVAYFLYNFQQRSFALHEYYGGVVRNGLPLLLAGVFLGVGALTKLAGARSWLLFLLIG